MRTEPANRIEWKKVWLAYALAITASLPGITQPAWAANRTWAGTDPGNTLWSTPSNWSPAGAPHAGDILLFPTNPQAGRTNENDLAAVPLSEVSFQSDYTVNGNTLVISNELLIDIFAEGDTTVNVNCGILLASNARFWAPAADPYILGHSINALHINGPINLNGFDLLLWAHALEVPGFNSYGKVFISGIISGNGNVITDCESHIDSGCFIEFNGPAGNTFTGTLEIDFGHTFLNKQAGSVVNTRLKVAHGIAYLSRPNQINDSATVEIEGITYLEDVRLDFSGHDEAFLDLDLRVFHGLDTKGGTFTLLRNLSSASSGFVPYIKGEMAINGTHLFTITNGLNQPSAYGLDFVGNISGSSGFSKAGPGTLRLAGNNTFAGTVSILDGLVEAASTNAFGSTARGVDLNGGGIVLRSLAIPAELLSVNGPGATLTMFGPCYWAGPISLSSTLTVYADNPTTFPATISGASGLSLFGYAFELAGSTANTFTGNTVMGAELLKLNKPSGVRALSGPLIVGSSASGQDEVRWLNNLQLPTAAVVTLQTSGLLALSGFTEIIDRLTFNGGHVNLGTGSALSLTGDLTANAATATALIDGATNVGALFLSGQRTFNIGKGTSATDLQIDSRIYGDGLNKTGPGTLLLRGNNGYASQTVVSNGILIADHNNALGSASAGTTVNSGGTLWLGSKPTVIGETLTLNGAGFGGTNGALAAEGVTTDSSSVVLQSASTIRTEEPAQFTLSGVISGTGPLTKTGSGLLLLTGGSDSTYTGTTFVNEGFMFLNKPSGVTSIPGHLVVGSGGPFGTAANVTHLAGSFTVGGSITVNRGSLYDLGGWSESFSLAQLAGQAPLTLNDGGDVQTGAGLLSLPAGTTVSVEPGVNGTSSISGHLGLEASMAFGGNHTFAVNSPFSQFAGAPLTISANLEAISSTAHVFKTGAGEMRLSGNNTYTGQLVVNGGQVTLASSTAAGATGGGAVVNSNSVLAIDGSLTVINEPLTLNSSAPVPFSVLSGSSTWDSTVALNQNAAVKVASSASLLIGNAITGSGALTKLGPGTLFFGGPSANTYTNTTRINEGTLVLTNLSFNVGIVGPLIVGDGIGGANADVVRLERLRQIGNLVPVTVNESGLLDINGKSDAFGSLAGSGNLAMGALGDVEVGADNTSTLFSGVISGAANFWKEGAGTMTLTGTNTHTGKTIVAGGKLLVHGFQPQSLVVVSNGSTLGGYGTVGHITVASGGAVTPGASAGNLNCSNAIFNPGSTFTVELTGVTKGAGYDRLTVYGTANLGSVTLNVLPCFGLNSSAPTEGTPLWIVVNDGLDAITGTFSGKPPNSTFTAGGMDFRIDYDGGTGNDVLLTLTNTALKVASASVITGNGNNLIDPNECNLLSLVITNTAADTSTNVQALLLCDTPNVTVTQPYARYGDVPAASRRTNTTPFQLSTAPEFVCGTPIALRLVVQTANHGAYYVPVVLANSAACAAGSGICELCPNTTLAGALGAGSLTHKAELVRDTAPSVCGAPKTCPGIAGAGGPRRSYDAHVFRNGPSNACIAVTLTATEAILFCAAYSNSFDPENVCANYLADAGDITDVTPWRPFAFQAAPNQAFVLVVAEDSPGTGGSYMLQVTGGDCRPQLRISLAGPTNAVLDWTTASVGYSLETTNKISGNAAPWSTVTDMPVVVNSSYHVTNAVIVTNQFYRLRKALP